MWQMDRKEKVDEESAINIIIKCMIENNENQRSIFHLLQLTNARARTLASRYDASVGPCLE